MVNKKTIFTFCASFLLMTIYSCDLSGPYLKHEMSSEKVAGDCNSIDPTIRVVANTIGERYTMQLCLDGNYDDTYTVERKGDTVDVQFKKPSGATAVYNITLDINTRPEYKFLAVNGNVMPVSVKRY